MTRALRSGEEPAVCRIMRMLGRHWLLVFNLSLGALVLGAMAAPALMALGMEGPGRALYTVYSFMCHQLPQRSNFLFGPQLVQTYSWDQLLASGMDPVLPRHFVGTAQIGYKMAFAHRLTAMYSSLLAGGLLFGLLRGRVRWHLSIRGYLLTWFLLALDGGSHLVSELTGWGFRADNEWLRALTGNGFPVYFYAGDGIGSFNWLMRTLTGALVGLATAWFMLPILRRGFERPSVSLKMQAAGQVVAASGEATTTALKNTHSKYDMPRVGANQRQKRLSNLRGWSSRLRRWDIESSR